MHLTNFMKVVGLKWVAWFPETGWWVSERRLVIEYEERLATLFVRGLWVFIVRQSHRTVLVGFIGTEHF
jgi:hypothetical protein